MNSTDATLEILRAMIATGREEPMINIVEVLKGGMTFEGAFHLANEMQNKNLVKLVYCAHPKVVNVQLTLVGEVVFEKSQRK